MALNYRGSDPERLCAVRTCHEIIGVDDGSKDDGCEIVGASEREELRAFDVRTIAA
jgi:hypothetical protein